MRKIFSPCLVSLEVILSIFTTLASDGPVERDKEPSGNPSPAIMVAFDPLSPTIIDLKLHLSEAFFEALAKNPLTPYPQPLLGICDFKEQPVKVDAIVSKMLNDNYLFWEKYRGISKRRLRAIYELTKKLEACPIVGSQHVREDFGIAGKAATDSAEDKKEEPPLEGAINEVEENKKEDGSIKPRETDDGSEDKKEKPQLNGAVNEVEGDKKEDGDIKPREAKEGNTPPTPSRLSSDLWGTASGLWSVGSSVGGYVVGEAVGTVSKHFKNRSAEKARKEREQAEKALEQAREDLRKIDEEYVTLQKEAKRRFPSLTLDEIDRRAYENKTVKKPEAFYPSYALNKTPSFYPPKKFVAFRLDPQDFEFVLARLPITIERLEKENKALECLIATYRKYIVAHWGDLDGDFLKEQVKAELTRQFPFSPLSDLRGEARRKLLSEWIKKPFISLEDEGNKQIDDRYGALPRNSGEEGKQEQCQNASFQQLLDDQEGNKWIEQLFYQCTQNRHQSPRGSFERFYIGSDEKEGDISAEISNGSLIEHKGLFYKITERQYQPENGILLTLGPNQSTIFPVAFIPVKQALKDDQQARIAYRELMETLKLQNVSESLEVDEKGHLPSHSLVEAWASMDSPQKRFPVMVREFRTYECIKHHRFHWIGVFEELHKKQSLVRIGFGEGLTKPKEPGPMDDPVEIWRPLEERQRFISQFRKLEALQEKHRNLLRDLFIERPNVNAPYPMAFYSFTRPKPPKPFKKAGRQSFSNSAVG